MKVQYSLAEDFGPELGDGDSAAEYRVKRIDPHVDSSAEIILDFTGVQRANSSFINALIAALLENHGEELLSKLVFKKCNPVVEVLVSSAVDLGLQKREARISA